MAEQIFIGDAQVADVAEGEEVFAGVALFSEEDAAPPSGFQAAWASRATQIAGVTVR